MRGLQRWLCGLRGHETLLHFEQARLCLECINCGYQTTGWATSTPTPPDEASATKPPTWRVRLFAGL